MENTVFVPQRLAHFALSFFARTQSSEIIYRLGHDIAIETHDNALLGLACNLDIKKHLVCDFRRQARGGDTQGQGHHHHHHHHHGREDHAYDLNGELKFLENAVGQ